MVVWEEEVDHATVGAHVSSWKRSSRRVHHRIRGETFERVTALVGRSVHVGNWAVGSVVPGIWTKCWVHVLQLMIGARCVLGRRGVSHHRDVPPGKKGFKKFCAFVSHLGYRLRCLGSINCRGSINSSGKRGGGGWWAGGGAPVGNARWSPVAGGAAAGAPGCLLALRSNAGGIGSSLGLGTLGTASWHRPAPSEVGGKASAWE